MLKTKFKNFDKFILRTPLFPIGFLNKLLSKDVNESSLKEICDNKVVQEAIFLASPNLHTKMIKWLNGELNDKKEIKNLPLAIYKYLARMSSRCTPFGLFAGNSIGYVGAETNLTIPAAKDYRRVTRLDMNYLCSLTQDLTKREDIRESTIFYPNNSIYEFGNKLRYTEYYYKNTNRIHHIAAVDNSEYLQQVINRARQGAKLQELAEILTDEGISIDDAKEFIYELIDSQFLLPEFEPSVTGKNFLESTLDYLKINHSNEKHYALLSNINQQLKEIDKQPPGINTEKYYKIVDSLKELDANYELKYLFQADMVKPTENLSINKELIGQVKEGIEVLNKFTLMPAETNLTKFKDAFYKKYEDAEIPLLQALDTESGVGYLQNHGLGAGDYAPLIDDVLLPLNNIQSMNITWNNIHSFLFKKYLEAIKTNQYEVELEKKEIEELEVSDNYSYLPVTFSSMVKLVNINGKEKTIIKSAGGSSATNLLGRFCHTDKNIKSHVANVIGKEESYYNDKIVAEIVHLPESRTGNILHRPILRQYEIPYLAKASVDKKFQIIPEDLFISIRQNKIVLRSKSLNKEIVPRLTSAHNFTFNALPVYQFLCDMQIHGLKGGVAFSWGPLSDQYSFLPRVCYKNLIFSLATWNIEKRDFEKLTKIKDDLLLLEEADKWRKKINMPEWVSLVDGDNELVIKLNHLLTLKTLISTVKSRSSFVLKEFFADEENMVIRNEEGRFTNEIIFSFYKEN